MQTTTIDLLRHGACEGGQIFRGSTDSPLSAAGLTQMQRAVAEHPQAHPAWQHIISSPLKRCHSFADQLGQQLCIPTQTKKDLQEIHFGDWEGQSTEAVEQHSAVAVQQFWRDPLNHPPPKGESLTNFRIRVQRCWQTLLRDYRGQNSLVITHGGVIRVILAELLQMPTRPLSYLSVPHACLTRICIYHQADSADWPQLIFHKPLNPLFEV